MRTRRAAYSAIAPFYDLLSVERPVYRRGRRTALELLDLTPGERVLDLGCGTGLDLPGVRGAVGAGGGFVGVDRSPAMLAVARRRAAGWPGAVLVRADLTGDWTAGVPAGVDAVLCCYALSLLPDPGAVLDAAAALARPGARLAVVDMQPARGRGRVLSELALWAGGADPGARPWTEVESRCTDVRAAEHWAGHVQVRVGTLSRPA